MKKSESSAMIDEDTGGFASETERIIYEHQLELTELAEPASFYKEDTDVIPLHIAKTFVATAARQVSLLPHTPEVE